MKKSVTCGNCKAELSTLQRSATCPQCSANEAEFVIDLENNETLKIQTSEQGIWKYEDFLPTFKKRISLGEGDTPLRLAQNLFSKDIQLLVKVEGKNPTGSFLDRVSPLMVSDAISRNMESIVCASDGNLGASISAYCAAADIKSVCVIPKSTSPEKKVQMTAYGAEIIDFGETIDDSLALAKKMADVKRYQATPEFNLLTIEGAKTISLEIVHQLLSQTNSVQLPWIEYLVVPIGSGRLLYSIWKGFKEAKRFGLMGDQKLPKIIGVQLKGHDSITNAIKSGDTEPKEIKRRDSTDHSLGDAILTRKSVYGVKAIQSIMESNGTSISVTEKEMINASKKLGKAEGVFAELSSATVIASIEKLNGEEFFENDTVVLALITASGLKTSRAFQKSTTRYKKVESFRSMGTKVEILTIIDSKEANFGYSIWKALGQSLSLQAVYQHLKELSSGNHIIEIESTERQKKYRLTEKGKKLIHKMKELEELLP